MTSRSRPARPAAGWRATAACFIPSFPRPPRPMRRTSSVGAVSTHTCRRTAPARSGSSRGPAAPTSPSSTRWRRLRVPAHRLARCMRAIQITEFGGPEVLVVRDIPEPEVPEGFLLADVSAAGLNYADTHQAENSYLAKAELPLVPGGEVVGTLDDGRRVVALVSGGAYAEKALVHPQVMWEVPDGVDDGTALALVLQGTTAWHLLKTSAALREGESVVVHAAAGGVGTIALQLAKRFGAGRVIGVASSEAKRERAERLGADATVDSKAEDLTAALREANEGKRVDVVLEMVGGRTFEESFEALAPFGRLVH